MSSSAKIIPVFIKARARQYTALTYRYTARADGLARVYDRCTRAVDPPLLVIYTVFNIKLIQAISESLSKLS